MQQRQSTKLSFVVAALVATSGSGLLLWAGIQSLRVTDMAIAAGAPEDTLGFGIFPVLILFAGPAVLAMPWLWRSAVGRRQRLLAASTTTLLVVSVAFSVLTYNLLRARVFK